MSKHHDNDLERPLPRLSESETAGLVADLERNAAAQANGPVVLSAVEAAYVAMIESEYRAAVMNAQQLRTARFMVVTKAHGIADGSSVTIVPGEDGRPMQLVVEPPAATQLGNNLGNGTGRPMGVT